MVLGDFGDYYLGLVVLLTIVLVWLYCCVSLGLVCYWFVCLIVVVLVAVLHALLLGGY